MTTLSSVYSPIITPLSSTSPVVTTTSFTANVDWITSSFALTTTFTPPASCFGNTFTLGSPSMIEQDHDDSYNRLYRGARSECYPPNFSALVAPRTRDGVAIFSSRYQIFSPGICPDRYTAQVQSFYNSTTFQTCCPTGMTLSGFCTESVATATDIVILSNTAGTDNTGVNPTASPGSSATVDPAYSTSTYSGGQRPVIYALPVVVAWRAEDLNMISPQGSSSTTLSAGARAGIGAGVALGAVFLIGVIWVALWRRHTRRRAATIHGDVHEQAEVLNTGKARLSFSATELDKDNAVGEVDMDNAVHEPDSRKAPIEADSANARVELDSGWRGWQAPSESKR